MRTPRPARLAAGLAAACLLLMTGCTDVQETGSKGFITGDGSVSQLEPSGRGEPVSLVGTDLAGEELDVASYRGKPVVMVVWGSWCTPCRAEAPDVVAAAEELEGTAAFLGINLRDPSTEKAEAFVRTFDVPYPSLHSPGGEAMLAFPGTLTPNTIPAFVVLDDEGRVAASIIGELPSTRTLVDVVEDVAGEASSPGTASRAGSGNGDG